MSLIACFERHQELGRAHEGSAQLWLQETRPTSAGGEGNRATSVKALRCAVSESSLEGPQQGKSLKRFLAHYNLSIRYWDLGKPKQAIAECDLAISELRKAGLPTGCATHTLQVMKEVHSHFRANEKRLQESCARCPNHVGLGYKLGIMYFDKRMLIRADEQLKMAREAARAKLALKLIGIDRQRLQLSETVAPRGWPAWLDVTEEPRNLKMANLLQEIEDDLAFLGKVRTQWSVENVSGTLETLQETGVVDGERRQLLPCLRRRFSQECQECDRWSTELFSNATS
eukprot:CAMPEP_0206520318 /NCGR_PEP_ID=MMETSP0324_2-20121206/65690_1 /ASSEMBLY_ACC=CAM_ASM_000836 /TAXON_ID=2866 /ORGANISM="Crypthecodinium cohnii, Strain Seligo" /LENGTH=285 /DNA_ID=CAMNT_0054014017 /DNA_START=6 /DNA_END=863 /DNA_ORIENTATION=-